MTTTTGRLRSRSVRRDGPRRSGPGARLLIVAAVAALAGLAGCDCRAKVTAMSTGLGDVRVQIAGAGGSCGGAPAGGGVEGIRGSAGGGWSAAVPASSNSPVIRDITYGTVPPGLKEDKPAAPLAPNDALEFRVHGPGFRGGVSLVV